MSIITYKQWQDALKGDLHALERCHPYLNAAGLEKEETFRTVEEMAKWCNSAVSLMGWIYDKEGGKLSQDEKEAVQADFMKKPLQILREVANRERRR